MVELNLCGEMLRYKLSECICWLAILADCMSLDFEEALRESLYVTYYNVKSNNKYPYSVGDESILFLSVF